MMLGREQDLLNEQLEAVPLMTLHASKGLEYKAVFIVGCENGLIPYHLYKNQAVDMEEEKRLLYVGMTRAKKYLYLSHAKKRFIHGKEYHLKRSLFVDSIEAKLMEKENNEENKKDKNNIQGRQLSLFD